MDTIQEYLRTEILKLQTKIDEMNYREQQLFNWYHQQKQRKLTPLETIQTYNHFQENITKIRKQKRKAIQSLKIHKKKLEVTR